MTVRGAHRRDPIPAAEIKLDRPAWWLVTVVNSDGHRVMRRKRGCTEAEVRAQLPGVRVLHVEPY